MKGDNLIVVSSQLHGILLARILLLVLPDLSHNQDARCVAVLRRDQRRIQETCWGFSSDTPGVMVSRGFWPANWKLWDKFNLLNAFKSRLNASPTRWIMMLSHCRAKSSSFSPGDWCWVWQASKMRRYPITGGRVRWERKCFSEFVGTIITYELVLIQFKTNDEISDYNPCHRYDASPLKINGRRLFPLDTIKIN